jgi:hypothetical protein
MKIKILVQSGRDNAYPPVNTATAHSDDDVAPVRFLLHRGSDSDGVETL